MPLKIIKGNIATIAADAIVNAANAELIPGGGVDAAINCAAGPELGRVMRGIGGTPPGTAVHTKAFNLPAKYVIHAVGPIYAHYEPAGARVVLSRAYTSMRILARRLSCSTVALPLLSTGVYGYPLDEACEIAVGCNMEPVGDTDIDFTIVAFSDELKDLCEKHMANLSR